MHLVYPGTGISFVIGIAHYRSHEPLAVLTVLVALTLCIPVLLATLGRPVRDIFRVCATCVLPLLLWGGGAFALRALRVPGESAQTQSIAPHLLPAKTAISPCDSRTDAQCGLRPDSTTPAERGLSCLAPRSGRKPAHVL